MNEILQAVETYIVLIKQELTKVNEKLVEAKSRIEQLEAKQANEEDKDTQPRANGADADSPPV